MSIIHQSLAMLIQLTSPPPPRDERGLSQSTENAILLAGAAAIALIIITAITAYVSSRMPS